MELVSKVTHVLTPPILARVNSQACSAWHGYTSIEHSIGRLLFDADRHVSTNHLVCSHSEQGHALYPIHRGHHATMPSAVLSPMEELNNLMRS